MLPPELLLTRTCSAAQGPCRVYHKCNIMAADTTTQACLEELLAVIQLHNIPVTAHLPAECGRSTGFVHGVDGEPADGDLLEAIKSSDLMASRN